MAATPLVSNVYFPSYLERHAEMQQKANAYAARMGITDSKKIAITSTGSDELTLRMYATNSGISASPVFMIDPDEVPHHLRLSGFDDPRLQSDAYLNQAATWIMDRLGIDKQEYPKTGLIELLKFWSDPDMAKKGRDFILCHELAHIANGDVDKSIQKALRDADWSFLLSFLAGAFIFAACGLIFSWGLLGLAVKAGAAIIAAQLVYNIARKCSLQWRQKAQIQREIQADLLAAGISGCPEGGAYYFEAIRSTALAERNDPKTSSATRDRISPSGDDLNDKTHPPLTQRIKYLRAVC